MEVCRDNLLVKPAHNDWIKMTTKILKAIEEFEAVRARAEFDCTEDTYAVYLEHVYEWNTLAGNRATHFTAALKVAVEALRYYTGRKVEIIKGQARLVYPSPCTDKPKMSFYEGETWLLGAEADEAVAEIERILGGGE